MPRCLEAEYSANSRARTGPQASRLQAAASSRRRGKSGDRFRPAAEDRAVSLDFTRATSRRAHAHADLKALGHRFRRRRPGCRAERLSQ